MNKLYKKSCNGEASKLAKGLDKIGMPDELFNAFLVSANILNIHEHTKLMQAVVITRDIPESLISNDMVIPVNID